jgi:hypothetical protein
MKAEDFKTIKVAEDTIKTLNLIAAHKDERQYEVVKRLAEAEWKKIKAKTK